MKHFTIIISCVIALVSILGFVLSRSVDFSSPEAAYRQGMSAFHSGEYERAIPALKAADQGGVTTANFALARIYKASGNDDLKAFQMFDKFARGHSSAGYKHPYAAAIAEAFVEVGKYYNSGIPGTDVKKDPHEAYRYFHHAAANLRNPIAAYHVALLYLSGEGVVKNARTAAKWLTNSYEKNHAQSQALLGNLFWQGKGVKTNKPLALSLLMMARTNSEDENCIGYDQTTQRRILKSFERIDGAVSQKIRTAANDIYEELYYPCFANIDLPAIEDVRERRVYEDGGEPNRSDGPPEDASGDDGPPMTFH